MTARLALAIAAFATFAPAAAQTVCMTSNCSQVGTPPGCTNRALPRTTKVLLGGGALVYTPSNPKIEPGDCITWESASATHDSSHSGCTDNPNCNAAPSGACEWDSGNLTTVEEPQSSNCFYDPVLFPPASSDNFYCRIHASPTSGTMRGTMRVTTPINLVVSKITATNSVGLTWNGGGVAGDVSYKVERQSGGDPRFPVASTATVNPDGGVLGTSFTDAGDLTNLTARYYLVRNKQSNEP